MTKAAHSSTRRRRSHVKYFGGLGNQLFQYNFAKYLSGRIDEPVLMLRSRYIARGDRVPLLDEFLIYVGDPICFPRYSISLPRNRYMELISEKLDSFGFSIENQMSNPWGEPKDFVLETPLPSCYLGYFQNTELVDLAIGTYVGSLSDFLAGKALEARKRLGLTGEETLMHVRRGDNLRPENNGMGNLSWRYYTEALRALKKDPSSAIVLTDDPRNVQSLVSKINPSRVLDPLECSPWEALALFATSKALVSSNSTLSWWGAYLSIREGREAVIPKTWFRNWVPDPQSRLQIKGGILVDSFYEN
jgi:Glycosyl transferase family 11